MKKIVFTLATVSALAVFATNGLENKTAVNSLGKAKLYKVLPTNSAFNDESLHAGIGGTWSAAGPVKGGQK